MSSLSPVQIRQFEEQGFVVARGLLSPAEDIDPIIAEYEGVLDRVASDLFEKGEISSVYRELPFGKRVIQIQKEINRSIVQHFDFSLPRKNITTETPIWLGEAVFNILSSTRLLDAIESLIGPEIFANPVQHVRMKLPESAISKDMSSNSQLARTPWHQDNGVVTPDADETNTITVWFPLWDAPISSGPLEIIPGSHLNGLMAHCPKTNGTTMSIPEKFLDEQPRMGIPLKRGDVLFMHKLTAHSSLPNYSDTIRWSFDLRYHPVGQPTGRDQFPGFVARSRKSPESELHDASKWAELWLSTRAALAVTPPSKAFSRWSADAPLCA